MYSQFVMYTEPIRENSGGGERSSSGEMIQSWVKEGERCVDARQKDA